MITACIGNTRNTKLLIVVEDFEREPVNQKEMDQLFLKKSGQLLAWYMQKKENSKLDEFIEILGYESSREMSTLIYAWILAHLFTDDFKNY